MIANVKILHVIDFLHLGGAEKVCVTLLNVLYEEHKNLALLILVEDGVLVYELDKNIPIKRLYRKSKYSVSKMRDCAKILNNFDIVHVHMRHNFRYTRLIQQVFFIKNKMILHDHYGKIDLDISIPLLMNNLLKPKYYIGVSSTLVKWAKLQLRLSNKNIFLLPNIIMKQANTKGNERMGIVMVGNIKPIKNQLFAIRLMKNINNTLTIYGAIQDEDYYQLLLAEIKLLKIENKISFRHGIINIQQELNNYEIGLQVSFSESGPLTLIEYLSQSLPFLSYNTGQVVAAIKKDVPELILDNFVIEQWETKLNEAINYDQNKINLVFKKHFNANQYVENCIAMYSTIYNSI